MQDEQSSFRDREHDGERPRAADVATMRARVRTLLRADPPGPAQQLFWRAVERTYADRPGVLLQLCDALGNRRATIADLAEAYFASGCNRIGGALDILALAESHPDRLPGFELLDPQERTLGLHYVDAMASAALGMLDAAASPRFESAAVHRHLNEADRLRAAIAGLPAARRWLVAAQFDTRLGLVRDALLEARQATEAVRQRLAELDRLGTEVADLLLDTDDDERDRGPSAGFEHRPWEPGDEER